MALFGNSKNDKLENLMDLLRLEKGVFFGRDDRNPIRIPDNVDCKSAIEGILTFIESALGRSTKRVEAYKKQTQNGSVAVVALEVPDLDPKNPKHKLEFHFDISRCQQQKNPPKGGSDWNTWSSQSRAKDAIYKDDSLLGRLFADDSDIEINLDNGAK